MLEEGHSKPRTEWALGALAALSVASLSLSDVLASSRGMAIHPAVFWAISLGLPTILTLGVFWLAMRKLTNSVHEWHRDGWRYPLLYVAAAGLLFVGGKWLSGIYGMDPPYWMWTFGVAMMLASLVLPILGACTWLLRRYGRGENR